MADMWYYTCEGKQMEPVTSVELKQLAASGMLKPTDMVWKEGMPKWVRASSTKELFADTGSMAPVKKAKIAEESFRAERDERPRRATKRERDDEDDDDDDRPRRKRRRSRDSEGMNTGLKVGLILGGSLFGILVIVIVIIVATRSSNNPEPAFVPPALVKQAPPQFAPIPPGGPRGHAPVFRGPLTAVPGGLTVTETLTRNDPLDFVMGFPCKVFTVNMKAGKTYTIRHSVANRSKRNLFDPFLRLEDSKNTMLASDDDSFGDLNSQIVYQPAQAGVYRVIATSLNNAVGSFVLQIHEN